MKINQNQNCDKQGNSHLKVFFGAQIAIQQQKARQQQEHLQKVSLGKTVANLHNIYAQHNYKQKQKDKDKQMEKIRYYFRKYQPLYFNNVDMKNFHYNTTNVKIKKYKEANYYGEVDLQNGKKNGRGIMVYSNGKIYQGQWKEDQKYGKGYQKFADGSVYQGDYIDGKPQGIGKLVNSNSELYQGEWKDGLKHRKGFWRGPKGDSYLGQWFKGKAEGYGVHTWTNGDKYEGQFKECLKHGQGIQKFSNGDIYKGTYQNGKPSGFGQYFWVNKSFFKGYFKNGLRSGHGVWKKGPGNSDKYEGQYQNDKKWGPGVFTWASGNMYKGNYNGDVRNGYGQMYWTDGSYYKGQWLNGVQHGKGQIFIPTIGYRKGIFQNNQINQVDYEQLILEENDQDYQNEANLKNLAKKINKKLPTEKSQSQLSATSKNRLKTNCSKIISIKQQNQNDNQQQSVQTKNKSSNKQMIIRTKTQSFQIKKRSQKMQIITKSIGDKSLPRQIQQRNRSTRYPIQQIFKQSDTNQNGLKVRQSLTTAQRSKNRNINYPPFFRYKAKQKCAQKRQTQQANQSHRNMIQSSWKDKNSIQFNNKKKDRLLHSSFYLHRFRNINNTNKNQNEETKNENVITKNQHSSFNQTKSQQNRLRASSLIKNDRKTGGCQSH